MHSLTGQSVLHVAQYILPADFFLCWLNHRNGIRIFYVLYIHSILATAIVLAEEVLAWEVLLKNMFQSI